jgi:hypothetical protein
MCGGIYVTIKNTRKGTYVATTPVRCWGVYVAIIPGKKLGAPM